ncbi:carbon monoxide dehydrogenase G protein [Amycolatopsis camponoti]|uniref:Carbon monoxide dehydrogenase G protein n=1 Tax=Amycolatopsis camponoti TaxID=2606593 RepID=A0A6I8LSL2_9PSEU|nr:SRPBCC family protein [Amycolatopsis camponoti]VVJ20080.1 carbon monoxide dehydrogenase G protein [Amycolatopsis camponoti]
MRLDHEFTVPAPIGEVWQAVVDPERVAPCMPGATLTKVEGDKFSGTVKVKLGPISLLYKGNGEFLEKDEAARKVTIKASGKDSRGSGTAAATVTLTLTEADGGTHGSVSTELSITGKPAQFGRGLISEVGGKILDTFAGCLSDKLAPSASPAPAPVAVAPTPEPTETAEPVAKPAVKPAPTTAEINTDPKPSPAPSDRPPLHSVPAAPETEAIDLLDYAGQSVLKRLAPVVAGIAAVIGLVAIIRALRK